MSQNAEMPWGSFAPVNAATGEVCDLAMQDLFVVGRVLPVGARLKVRHVFRSHEPKPIEVVYAFALPRDAAMRSFSVTGEGFSVQSELRTIAEAVKEYEQGIDRGHLATLARQYGDGAVNLAVGNVRPGETVTVCLEVVAGVEQRDDGFRFRFPFTLAPSYHAKARPIELAPGEGEIELPLEDFDDLLLPRWKQDADELHAVGFSLSVWAPQGIMEVASPSHPLRVATPAPTTARAVLATQKDVPNRDLVLDVRYRSQSPAVLTGPDRGKKGRFAVIVPSAAFGQTTTEPRRVAFVVDRSGSMSRVPMAQAKTAVNACLGALSEQDSFAVVAFDNRVESAAPELLRGDEAGRAKARGFLEGIDARGGTELAQALLGAAGILAAGGGGDILLLTDGQVMGTEMVMSQVKVAGVRIHCLGIGSASQDRFLALLARETGGISRMVTPRERVDMAAMELFSAVGRPVASEVRVEVSSLPGASLAPEPPTAVFAGTPLVIHGSADCPADGQLEIVWMRGRQQARLAVPLAIGPKGPGELLGLLQGARLITSLDAQYGSAGQGTPEEKRRQLRIAKALEELGREFGLASRRMALVAVVHRRGDKAGEVPQTRVVPVGMPQDVQFQAYFAAGACPPMPAHLSAPPRPGKLSMPAQEEAPLMSMGIIDPSAWRPDRRGNRRLSQRKPQPAALEDVLLDLASRIEADGGLPGRTQEKRVLACLLALLLFAVEGHTARGGAFMPHVQRLLSFLQAADLTSLSAKRQSLASTILQRLSQDGAFPGPWTVLVQAYLAGSWKVRLVWQELDSLNDQ